MEFQINDTIDLGTRLTILRESYSADKIGPICAKQSVKVWKLTPNRIGWSIDLWALRILCVLFIVVLAPNFLKLCSCLVFIVLCYLFGIKKNFFFWSVGLSNHLSESVSRFTITFCGLFVIHDAGIFGSFTCVRVSPHKTLNKFLMKTSIILRWVALGR